MSVQRSKPIIFISILTFCLFSSSLGLVLSHHCRFHTLWQGGCYNRVGGRLHPWSTPSGVTSSTRVLCEHLGFSTLLKGCLGSPCICPPLQTSSHCDLGMTSALVWLFSSAQILNTSASGWWKHLVHLLTLFLLTVFGVLVWANKQCGVKCKRNWAVDVSTAKGHILLLEEQNIMSSVILKIAVQCWLGFLPLQPCHPSPASSPNQKQHQSNQNGNVRHEWGPSPSSSSCMKLCRLFSSPC